MKKLSNWFIGVWLSFCSYLELWPDSMTHVWMFMPDDLKSEIPDSVVKGISYSVLVLSMIFWLKNRQPKLWRDKPESEGADGDGAIHKVQIEVISADKSNSN
jgi:hypothetical protein